MYILFVSSYDHFPSLGLSVTLDYILLILVSESHPPPWNSLYQTQTYLVFFTDKFFKTFSTCCIHSSTLIYMQTHRIFVYTPLSSLKLYPLWLISLENSAASERLGPQCFSPLYWALSNVQSVLRSLSQSPLHTSLPLLILHILVISRLCFLTSLSRL